MVFQWLYNIMVYSNIPRGWLLATIIPTCQDCGMIICICLHLILMGWNHWKALLVDDEYIPTIHWSYPLWLVHIRSSFISGWWFGTYFIFPHIEIADFDIVQRGGSTTNQKNIPDWFCWSVFPSCRSLAILWKSLNVLPTCVVGRPKIPDMCIYIYIFDYMCITYNLD